MFWRRLRSNPAWRARALALSAESQHKQRVSLRAVAQSVRHHEVSILILARPVRCGVLRLAAAREGLDDDHAAAAAGAGMLWCFWLVGLGVGGLDGIDRDEWHCEQFAGTRDVVGTGGAGEQAVVADAVEALRAARASGSGG